MQTRNVVITGAGIVTSLGVGWTDFAAGLREGRSNFCGRRIEGIDESVAGAWLASPGPEYWGHLQLSQVQSGKLEKLVRQGPSSVVWSAVAALEACASAGLSAAYTPEEWALIVGVSNLSLDTHYREAGKFLVDPNRVSPRWALQFADTDQIGALSELLGIQGEGFTVGGNSASGNLALIQGWRAVVAESCEACVVVGAMCELSPVEIQALRFIGAMGGRRPGTDPDRACRPFDTQHEGFVIGQGCAAVVLEFEESARARGADIICQLVPQLDDDNSIAKR